MALPKPPQKTKYRERTLPNGRQRKRSRCFLCSSSHAYTVRAHAKGSAACPQVLGIEVALQVVVTRNLVIFATFFVQARPILAVPGQK